MRSLVLQLIALLILADVCAQLAQSVNDAPGSEALSAILPGVPDTRQSTEYSCGAAALQAVLSYWGRDVGEEDLMEILNTDLDSGRDRSIRSPGRSCNSGLPGLEEPRIRECVLV